MGSDEPRESGRVSDGGRDGLSDGGRDGLRDEERMNGRHEDYGLNKMRVIYTTGLRFGREWME